MKCGESVKLVNAERGATMTARVAKGVSLKIGSLKVRQNVYAAPIADQMLLGLDFLRSHGVTVDLGCNHLTVKGKVIPAVSRLTPDGPVSVARVTLPRRVVVPPYSQVVTRAELSNDRMTDYVLQPSGGNKGLLFPNMLVANNEEVPVTLRNVTSKYVTLKKGHNLGQAVEAEALVDEEAPDQQSLAPMEEATCFQVRVDQQPRSSLPEVPEHLQDLFERSSAHLSEEQKEQVAKLLIEFEDVFARHDLDLGCFTAIKHHIDTGDSKPIKQRMRRTPLGFEGEEQKHLESMLEAGVISPSTSEWASPPVLVRKKDGGVRWCILFFFYKSFLFNKNPAYNSIYTT